MRLAHLLKPALLAVAAVSFAACSKSDNANTGATTDGNAAAGSNAAGGTNATASNAPGATQQGEFSGNYAQTFPAVQTIAMRANFAGNVQDAVAGRAAFLKYNCVGCHGGLAGGAMGPSLRDDTWKFGGTDEQILNTLHNGRPAGMPAWKGKIPDAELKQIIAYIRSMRTPQEPTYFFTANDANQNQMTAFLSPASGGGVPAAGGAGGAPAPASAPQMPAGSPATTKGAASGGTQQ